MEKKLGLSALTALVLSSMLGAGVFSLPQNMAAVASPAALLIGWAITGAGILLLAFAMLILTRIRPELDGGIFTYARDGFGELIGFCSAWDTGCVPLSLTFRIWSLSSLHSASLPTRLSYVCLATVIPGSRLWAHRCCCGSYTSLCCVVCKRQPVLTWSRRWRNYCRWVCLSCWRSCCLSSTPLLSILPA